MIWDRHLHALIPRNPIVSRDLLRQERTTSFLRGNLESVGVVSIALGFSLAMLASVVYNSDPQYLSTFLEPIQILAWIFHAAAVLRLLAAGVFSIAQDSYLLSSDDLRLTPLTNWQLLGGKWWTAMHQVRGWLLALGIVQLGIVVSVGFGQMTGLYADISCIGGSPCEATIYGLYNHGWLTLERTTFIAVSAIGIAILETICCTALGIAVALVIRNKLGLIIVVALRFTPVLIFSWYPSYSWQWNDLLLDRYTQYTWFSFADGGTGAIMQMAFGHNPDRGLLGLFAVSGMFFIYLSLSLVTAWAVMRRSRR